MQYLNEAIGLLAPGVRFRCMVAVQQEGDRAGAIGLEGFSADSVVIAEDGPSFAAGMAEFGASSARCRAGAIAAVEGGEALRSKAIFAGLWSAINRISSL